MVHDGAGFQADKVQSGLASAATGNVVITTGAKPIHVRGLDIAMEVSPGTLKMFEGPTITVPGTAFETSGDTNRITSNTPTASFSYAATVSANGTQLTETLVTSPAKDAGSVQSRFGEEIILKANTDYLITLLNSSGGPISWGFKCFWYEIPDGYSY